MTLAAFHRTAAVFLMTLDTLIVKGICTFGAFLRFDFIGIMAVETGVVVGGIPFRVQVACTARQDLGNFFNRIMVVAVVATDTITGVTRVGLMAE